MEWVALSPCARESVGSESHCTSLGDTCSLLPRRGVWLRTQLTGDWRMGTQEAPVRVGVFQGQGLPERGDVPIAVPAVQMCELTPWKPAESVPTEHIRAGKVVLL